LQQYCSSSNPALSNARPQSTSIQQSSSSTPAGSATD
jgi:hypothetical protein